MLWLQALMRYCVRKTHDLFVNYFKEQSGWKVTSHAYDIETAFSVEFSHSPKSIGSSQTLPTIGFQS
jgi:hypothetical protein